MTLTPIAHIKTDLPTKFGVPRQSGLVPALKGRIVFETPFRNADALRGLEDFDYLWLIWSFSAHLPQHSALPAPDSSWALVRPPRLGGNEKMGVWATRSSFRPNGLALSSVRIEKIETDTPDGPVIHVTGVDMMDGTPIYDIKPYVTFTDSHPEARSGFVDTRVKPLLDVHFPEEMLSMLPVHHREAAASLIAQDPRPAYQDNTERIYGFSFAGYDIRFCVHDDRVAEVVDVKKL